MGNELTESERLAIVETQLKNVLEGMASLTKSFTRLEEKLDRREENFVTTVLLDEKFRLRDDKIDGLQKAIVDIRSEKQSNKNNLPVWLSILPSLAAVVVAIIAIYK
ncbi:hypothetical protein BC351_10630 [Paenibacillus ferrarius]|uniref:Uncharacterized protein n=1 Tax=Paenibacillus ferrarius TaxID=1469647 RepID=A0A1V4H951_9BACL|nr:hypothetical protein [Paenibacillus ferrarius]OPH47636.1 hypothetical protein BC351_10630 [Paenibacillus ferrarius]